MKNKTDLTFDKIIKNQDVIPFFLSYIKQNLLVRKLPTEIPFDASEAEKTHFLKTTWDFKHSAENVINKLHQEYQVPNDLSEENSQMNLLLDKVCQYLIQEKGENHILNFEDKELLEKANS